MADSSSPLGLLGTLRLLLNSFPPDAPPCTARSLEKAGAFREFIGHAGRIAVASTVGFRRPRSAGVANADRRTRFEPLWHAALAEFSDDELLTAAAVLDRMRSMFDAVNDGDH